MSRLNKGVAPCDRRIDRRKVAFAAAVTFLMLAASANGTVLTWTIVDAHAGDALQSTDSFMTINGMISGSNFSPQWFLSDKSTFGGTIKADLTGSTVTFSGGSNIVGDLMPDQAAYSGNYPGIAALAANAIPGSIINFALATNASGGLFFQVADINLDLISGTLTNGAVFNGNVQTVSGNTYFSSFSSPTVVLGTPISNANLGLTNTSGLHASLTNVGNVWTMVIPIRTDLGDNSPGQTHVLTIGQITATVTVPEPSTVTLFGFGVVGLFSYAWRVRKRKTLVAWF